MRSQLRENGRADRGQPGRRVQSRSIGSIPGGFRIDRARQVGRAGRRRPARRGGLAPSRVYFVVYFNLSIIWMGARNAVHKMAARIDKSTDLLRPSDLLTDTRAECPRSATAAAPLSLSSSPDRSGMVAPGGKTRRGSPTGGGIGTGRLRSSGSQAENEADGMNQRRGGGRSGSPAASGRLLASGRRVDRGQPVGSGAVFRRQEYILDRILTI